MRKDDPGYKTRIYPAVVTVDGVPIQRCFTADEELGEAWCYATDEAGKLIPSPCGTRPVEVCIRGKVVITPGRQPK